MDTAAAYLHRKERKAIEKRRKKEPVHAMAVVVHGGHTGVMAVTPARILFAHRKGLGSKVLEWSRRSLRGVRCEMRRYGIIQLRAPAGVLAFELTSRPDRDLIMDTLRPRPAPVDPVRAAVSTARAPRPHPRRASRPAVDPLAHREGAAHEAKLREMYAKGVITKAELEWQLER